MYFDSLALALVIIFLDLAQLVSAGLFILEPTAGSTCTGGQPCTITWVDDGTFPVLSSIGVATVGLFTGKQQLVQSITPVDVTKTRTVTFTPNPAAGPNSDTYYIAIASTTLKNNSSAPYTGWSPFFRLVGMSGSFDTPLPAATSPIPIPASLTRTSSSPSVTSTITVGTINTSLPPIATPTSPPPRSSSSSASQSRFSTSVLSSSSSSPALPASTSSTPTPTPTPSTSGAVRDASHHLTSLLLLVTAITSLALFS
ncbi:hypothetical protein CVT24_000663 [Panaeolus cyanescens]|uniref:Yeast cell wall synthesis Kre9/Knh1-like N-terminal domain-containing protein n=1 Tax=Panaeolus cyanescens TaxID=181874 RepID=A0A409W772_9AGAR|nr:hypothetical protein CVT24_000663 [Panaeolus cyanescens]